MTKLQMQGYLPGEERNGMDSVADEFLKPEGKSQPIVAIVVLDTAKSGYDRVNQDDFAQVRISQIEPITDPEARARALDELHAAYDARQNHAALEMPATEESEAVESDGPTPITKNKPKAGA